MRRQELSWPWPSTSTLTAAPVRPNVVATKWGLSRRTSMGSIALFCAVIAAIWPVYADASEVVHVVVKGQTLGAIARRYRISVEDLRDVNGLRAGQRIKPGLALTIPEKGKIAEAKKAAAQRAARAETARKAADTKKKSDPKSATSSTKTKAEPYATTPKRPGFVRMVRGTEHFEGQLITRRGRLNPSALPSLSRMMKHVPSDSKTNIDPRLATLIGMVSDHFGGRPIHVVSGYRPYTPTQFTKDSNHNHGRALDFSIPGVPNTVIRDFCRTFRNAGVGYYPNSSFVHLDVRATKFFWIDYSRPGEAPKYDSPQSRESADEATGDVGPTNPTSPSGEGSVEKTTNETPTGAESGSK
ncbi:MAG TPA: DUF882 domain-containing protein [Polyangium sp.]|nr:DUF882 domain-containing protein [Polyangium sp.]